MELKDLEPLVGEWRTTVKMPDGTSGHGSTTFEWLEGGGYLIERATTEDTEVPQGIMVIGPDVGGERIVQHYFDSRGVARIYDIELAGGELRIWRDDPGFAQRYIGRLSGDGKTIEGGWERCHDGETWIYDFDLNYEKRS
jgi:hypothetical protein